jgi:4a-hydroxytetrahydrobiopterin dehydratase
MALMMGVPGNAGQPPMSERKPERTYADAEVIERLKQDLPHWALNDGRIVRRYRTSGWKATLMVVNAIGHLAEAAWHHPYLRVSYAWIEVVLQTHSAKGITDKDLALARKIEDLVAWQPGKEDGPFDGTPSEPRFAYIRYDD